MSGEWWIRGERLMMRCLYAVMMELRPGRAISIASLLPGSRQISYKSFLSSFWFITEPQMHLSEQLLADAVCKGTIPVVCTIYMGLDSHYQSRTERAIACPST